LRFDIFIYFYNKLEKNGLKKKEAKTILKNKNFDRKDEGK